MKLEKEEEINSDEINKNIKVKAAKTEQHWKYRIVNLLNIENILKLVFNIENYEVHSIINRLFKAL